MRLRLSAAGHLLDLRYRVKDSQRAGSLLASRSKPSLVDPASGLTLTVPTMAYVGALRQTSLEPQAGKVYFILFSNPHEVVKAGQTLDLVLGDRVLPGLTVR